MGQMQPSLVGSMFNLDSLASRILPRGYFLLRLDRLTQTAAELSQATGQECIPAQADVRFPPQLKEAVAKTIAKFGRIDYVICGKFPEQAWDFFRVFITILNIGAAGNFLVPISGMSENAFKTVMEIDTVCSFLDLRSSGAFIDYYFTDWFFQYD